MSILRLYPILEAPRPQTHSVGNEACADALTHVAIYSAIGYLRFQISTPHDDSIIYCDHRISQGAIMAAGDLAARLRKIREKRGLTAHVMAEMTGIPKRTLESYMRVEGAPLPGLEALKKISTGLEVSLDWLVFGGETVGDDVGRLVRLSARAAAVQVFDLILERYQHSGSDIIDDTSILGLTPEEWASEIGWDAGERAKELAASGISQDTLRTGERVVQNRLLALLEERHSGPSPESSAQPDQDQVLETEHRDTATPDR